MVMSSGRGYEYPPKSVAADDEATPRFRLVHSGTPRAPEGPAAIRTRT